jgi:hypothetical protein
MRESSSVPTTTAAMLPPPRPEVRLTRGPPAATGAGPPEVRLLPTEDHDRIAAGLTDIVVRRLFSAGLALEAGVGLMGHHRMGGTVREAIGELDLGEATVPSRRGSSAMATEAVVPAAVTGKIAAAIPQT